MKKYATTTAVHRGSSRYYDRDHVASDAGVVPDPTPPNSDEDWRLVSSCAFADTLNPLVPSVRIYWFWEAQAIV